MTEHRQGKWALEGKRLLTGLGGGLIVGIPALYTMELWFIGMYISDLRLVFFILITLVINFGLNIASGYSEKKGTISHLSQSIVAYGMSAVISFLVLLLIGSITLTSLPGTVSQVALTAIPVSFGFSVARTRFSGQSRDEQSSQKSGKDQEKEKAKVDIKDVAISIAGVVIFFFIVAPAEEIMIITSRTGGYHWAGLVLFSLLMTYAIVFKADFSGKPKSTEGFLQKPITETILAYVVAVLTGLALEFLLGRIEVFSSVSSIVGHAAVLGLPASVGAAAGRIVV